MKPSISHLLTTTWLAVAATTVHAGDIPYPNAGTENPVIYTFTAANTGSIGGYFFSGQGASYTNELTMLVNNVPTGIQGLNNHTSAYGSYLNLGSVNAGDVLVFEMVNLNPGTVGPWFSDKSMNMDGSNHVYSTAWTGDGTIAAGTYLAFEDLNARNGSDFNYNDLAFIFTNVSVLQNVPEPGTMALAVLAGFACVTAIRRRRGEHKQIAA